jgi:hypothetical protein
MVVYIRNAAIINVFHVDSIIDFNTVNMLIICESIAFSWVCYFRVKSILTSRILILELDSTFLSLITTLASILNFFNTIVRYISSYFFKLNLDL